MREVPNPDIKQNKDDLTALRDDSRSMQQPEIAEQSPLAEAKPMLPKPNNPATAEVKAPALPARLKSRINLEPTEQARQAPATQELDLRHGECSSS